ncbi:unnamed protein product, partial [marine sediment metagenome]
MMKRTTLISLVTLALSLGGGCTIGTDNLIPLDGLPG